MAGLVANADECLMHFSTTQCNALRCVFDVCARLILEGTLVFRKEGLRMDVKSHILYVSMFLPADCIDQYIFNSPEPISCDINFKGVYEKLKFAAQDDIVTFQYTKTTTGKHTLLLHVQKGTELLMSWELGLLMLPTDDYRIDWAVFDRKITMDSSEFQLTIRAMHQQGEYMQLLCSRDPTYLFFVCCSLDANLYVTVKCEDDADPDENDETKPVAEVEQMKYDPDAAITVDTIAAGNKECDKRDLYSTRVLSDIAQASNGGKEVELFLKPETPLGMKFAVGTLGHILFCLACQVEPGKITLEECVTGKASERRLALAPHIKPKADAVAAAAEEEEDQASAAVSVERPKLRPSAKKRRTAKTPGKQSKKEAGTKKPGSKKKKTIAPTKPLKRKVVEESEEQEQEQVAPEMDQEQEQEPATEEQDDFLAPIEEEGNE